MRIFRLQTSVLALSLLAAAGFVAATMAPVANAQTATTGALSGSVMDQTGAVVPGATVVVTDTSTDSKLTVVTNAEGRYTVGLLKPGLYKVTASAAGLQSETLQTSVILGTTVPADIKVTPKGDKTIVEVTSTNLPLVDTENVALATTFNEQQISELPTPGGDVTTIAFTAPGVVVNAGTGFGYGNFSSDGLPGISNLFVLNGFDNQDPFLNLNNSGSSNLTLGQGELQEATVVQNGYNSQYGRAAGAIINYTTKSGGNKFHGMADYNYNGTVLNANGWFTKHDQALGGAPNTRPHAVSNEWAVNTGGPIIKDKVFFFGDWEGLRYVLPGNAGLLNYPSAQFQAATLANVPASAVDFYKQTFAVFQSAPTYGSAAPLAVGGATAGGCGDVAGAPAPGGGYFGAYPKGVTSGALVPCMTEGFESVNNINKEWLFTGRGDWYISDRHKIYGRYKMDRGSQPTGTSLINPVFNEISIQPEYEGQFNDSYIVSPTKTNVFVAAANWYTAYFGPTNIAAADAAYPWYGIEDAGFDGSGNAALGATGLSAIGGLYYFPQGRNVTQYQLEDDFSWIHGKHTLKFGENFRRDLVEDFDAQVLQDFPLSENFDLNTFYQGALNPAAYGGVTGIYIQNYPTQSTAHLALYNVGVYVQDEWQVLPNLKLTLGARVDRTGNPLCHGGCFSEYTGSFPNSGAGLNTAFNSEIKSQNWHALPDVQKINFQPRFGFNYSFDQKTEIRGGVGIFSDLYPASFLDGIIQNFPNVNSVEVLSGKLQGSGAGGVTANAGTANSTLEGGFASGKSVLQINNELSAQGVPFTPPSIGTYFPGTFKSPEYLEFSLQLQRQLTRNDAIIITYAGNYGYDGVLLNPYVNAADGDFGAGTAANPWGAIGNLGGLPATPPDPAFSKVVSYTNNGHANYNGGMISYKRNGYGVTGQISYTYSHSLDMISNGGEGLSFTGSSLGTQLSPTLGAGNLNYSNSDYDIRNNLVADLVYEEPYKSSNLVLNSLAGGWVLGGKTYYRGGEPFSLINSTLGNTGYTNLPGPFMVEKVSGVGKLADTVASNPKAAVYNSGLGSCAQFVGFDSNCNGTANTQSTFGDVRRNTLYGPHYVDTDLSLLKKIVKTEGLTFSIGANAYNVFNKVSFGPPNGTVGPGFGLIGAAVQAPTSPYGSFQGAVVTGRVLQVHGKITF
jgi:outer membrane receptor protein involved in Fe transport